MNTESNSALTPRQKQLVRDSFASVQEYSNSLTKLFYGRLFELSPGVRGLFKNSLEEQSQKLLAMIGTIVEALDHMQAFRPELVALGRKHVTYGAQPEHYDIVRKALLWALARALEYEFDSETKSAWDQLLRNVTAAMLEGTQAENAG